MRRPVANEIPELVRALGHRDRARVDAARARLSIIGARAVEHLVEALEGSDNRLRARVMPLLALIRDPRGREPLLAMLLDRTPQMRRLAARCLGRFPAADSVAALNRLLRSERSIPVRVAAVHSLVEIYVAGREAAIRRVLDLLVDGGQPARVRLAAFTLLDALRPAQQRGILSRLVEDADADVRQRARERLERPEPSGDLSRGEIASLLSDLAASDYPVWNEAVTRLAACGAAGIEPILEQMERRAHDPEFCTRAGMALKGLGPRRARDLADALERTREPMTLRVLVETIGALGEKPAIYRLKDLIDRLVEPARDGDDPEPLCRVRAKAHLELARIGSRVAIRDLRDSLSGRRRVELELLAAIGLIGKPEEIPLLLQVYGREDAFARTRVADAVRAIMRRERLRRNARIFQALRAEQRRALQSICGAERGSPPGPPPAGA